MEFISQSKLAKNIFRLLKVNEIIFPIGRTSKGNLGLRFNANLEGFDIMLDSIPLSTKDMLVDDNNIELKRIIEKYWFEGQKVLGGSLDLNKMVSPYPEVEEQKERLMKQVEESGIAKDSILNEILTTPGLEVSEGEPLKKKGRPKGSKNKVKEVVNP